MTRRTKYEYKTVNSKNQLMDKELNKLGKAGWQLAMTVYWKDIWIYTFRRAITNDSN